MVSVRQKDEQYLTEVVEGYEGYKRVGAPVRKFHNGRKVDEYTLRKYLSTAKFDSNGDVTSHSKAETVARYAGGVFAGPLNISKKVRDETWGMAGQGYIERKVYVTVDETPEDKKAQRIKDKQHLGYVPGKSKSIQKYLADPNIRAQLCEANGHYYMVDQRAEGQGISRIIFVPDGNFDKATSYTVCDAKTGDPIKNRDALMRHARSFCASYHDIEEGWDKEAGKIAENLNKNDRLVSLNGATFTKEDVKKKKKSVVIDVDSGHARVYTDHRTSLDTSSYRTGTTVSLSDSVNKEIKKLYDKDLMDNKEKLHEPNQPFAKPKTGTETGGRGLRDTEGSDDEDDGYGDLYRRGAGRGYHPPPLRPVPSRPEPSLFGTPEESLGVPVSSQTRHRQTGNEWADTWFATYDHPLMDVSSSGAGTSGHGDREKGDRDH